jgi:6-phosphogluconolactonase (cycloisomerase 2 family)
MGAGADGRAPASLPDNLFLICSYNEASKLAHTPAGAPDGVGVYTVALDTDSGALRAVDAVPAGPNPAFTVMHPTLPVVYASTERIDSDGEVMAFAMGGAGEKGALRLLSKRSSVRSLPLCLVACPRAGLRFRSLTDASSRRGRAARAQGGKSTCFLHVHPSLKYLLAVNYWDAKVTSLPLAEDGSLLPEAPSVVLQQPRAAEFFAARAGEPATREEHWRFRQRWPHSHCCVQEPYTRRHALFVTDLGLDRVDVYEARCARVRVCVAHARSAPHARHAGARRVASARTAAARARPRRRAACDVGTSSRARRDAALTPQRCGPRARIFRSRSWRPPPAT